MTRTKLIPLSLLATLACGTALAQVGPVNIPAGTDYRVNGDYVLGVERTLGPGSYLVHSVGRDAAAGFDHDAWNYAGGWLNQYFIWTADKTYWAGTLNASGTNWRIFDTAAEALAVAQATFSPLTLVLGTEQTVRFGIADSFYGDNSAGISLNIAAVPEPASWALMLAGFGLVGTLVRRRRP